MAKITRALAKIFGSNAGATEIGEFGSLAAGGIVYTTNPVTIQSLSQYLDGWFAAVVGQNSPAIEDMNALCYLYAYQIAYAMQTMGAEYDATTTYYIGSVVNDGFGLYYVSKTDTNLGNALTDGTKWRFLNGYIDQSPAITPVTIPTGKTQFYPLLTIASGKTWTVDSGGALICAPGGVIVTGTLIVNGTLIF